MAPSPRAVPTRTHHITKVYLPTSGPEDWQRGLAAPETQWRRGYSAMATALCWEAAKGALPTEIDSLFGGGTDLLLALPEHRVALPGGGRASQCDVFALLKAGGETIALAIEAKVDEPFGPTIGEWMENASPGKIARLRFICDLLGVDTPPPDARYQLFHRTAAAVLEAQRFATDRAAMIVQSFSPTHRWFADFGHFAGLFGHAAVRGRALDHTLPSGMVLSLGWASGSQAFL